MKYRYILALTIMALSPMHSIAMDAAEQSLLSKYIQRKAADVWHRQTTPLSQAEFIYNLEQEISSFAHTREEVQAYFRGYQNAQRQRERLQNNQASA